MASQTSKILNTMQLFSPFIKVAATVVIAGAIFLELFNLGLNRFYGLSLQGWDLVFLLGRIAMVAHALEAIAAAIIAPSLKKSPWKYGAYTFFVGTVGLAELWQERTAINEKITP